MEQSFDSLNFFAQNRVPLRVKKSSLQKNCHFLADLALPGTTTLVAAKKNSNNFFDGISRFWTRIDDIKRQRLAKHKKQKKLVDQESKEKCLKTDAISPHNTVQPLFYKKKKIEKK